MVITTCASGGEVGRHNIFIYVFLHTYREYWKKSLYLVCDVLWLAWMEMIFTGQQWMLASFYKQDKIVIGLVEGILIGLRGGGDGDRQEWFFKLCRV